MTRNCVIRVDVVDRYSYVMKKQMNWGKELVEGEDGVKVAYIHRLVGYWGYCKGMYGSERWTSREAYLWVLNGHLMFLSLFLQSPNLSYVIASGDEDEVQWSRELVQRFLICVELRQRYLKIYYLAICEMTMKAEQTCIYSFRSTQE